MADLRDGVTVLKCLADMDWYGASARELAGRLAWDYQKTLRVLTELECVDLAHQQPNSCWRLSERFLDILTRCQASYFDRLNSIQKKATENTEIAEAKYQEALRALEIFEEKATHKCECAKPEEKIISENSAPSVPSLHRY